ncbi:MAG: hypothetical protein ACRDTG_02810 [Pseudonocardiaceae bacterium]
MLTAEPARVGPYCIRVTPDELTRPTPADLRFVSAGGIAAQPMPAERDNQAERIGTFSPQHMRPVIE